MGDEFEAILRFWLDRGVDGFRIDVAHGLAKDRRTCRTRACTARQRHDGRRICDQPDGARHLPALAKVLDPTTATGWRSARPGSDDAERLARYVRAGRAAPGVQLRLADRGLVGGGVPARRSTTRSRRPPTVGASPTWVLSNHDVVRHVTRYGGGALGLGRARAATLLMLALPGAAYLYQGEELGLPEVDVCPTRCWQDPIWERSGHTRRGRDGCRVPLPWSGDARRRTGSGPVAGATWLPQPADLGAADGRGPDRPATLDARALPLGAGAAPL